jgi:hypothetical protein
MARIFSISFRYTNNDYHAIISVKKNPFFTEYEVNLLDNELNGLLPSSKIISSAPDQYSFLNVSKDAYTPLMQDILAAIAAHVQTLQMVNNQP